MFLFHLFTLSSFLTFCSLNSGNFQIIVHRTLYMILDPVHMKSGMIFYLTVIAFSSLVTYLVLTEESFNIVINVN